MARPSPVGGLLAGLAVLFSACALPRSGPTAPHGVPPAGERDAVTAALDAHGRAGLALSVLPNLGFEGVYEWDVGRPRGARLQADVHGALQFLDDETFADDGNPDAGTWTQAGFALRLSSAPVERRSWTLRFGPEWFRARGAPNLVEDPGDYFGLRTGVGFETELAPGLVFGPELSILSVFRAGELHLVPQLVWGVRWRL